LDLKENSGVGCMMAVSYSYILAIEPNELLELPKENTLPDLSDFVLND
jgi:hypothetical protein